MRFGLKRTSRGPSLFRSGVFDPDFRGLRTDQKLALIALVFLPFQYALTINVGAPLKISELLFAASMVARVVIARRVRVRGGMDLYLILVLSLLVLVSAACALVFQDMNAELPGVETSPVIDLGFYTIYGVFALLVYLIVREVPAGLSIGALMQASWLCFIAVVAQAAFWLAGVPWMLERVGFFMGQQGWRVFGVALARSGPFLEGQHLGFFAGAMLIVAILSRRPVTAAALLVCVVYSRSTTAFAGIVIAFVVVSLLRPRRRVLIGWLSVAVVGALAIAVVPSVRAYFVLQLAKFGIGASGRETRSLEVRTEKTEVGIRMMLDHLPFGVGSGRFSAFYFDYTDGVDRAADARDTSGRPLVENGYLHLGSEIGILALLIFAVLLVWLIVRLGRHVPWATGLAAFVYVGIATQSSWTFGPIWVFLGVLGAAVVERESCRTSGLTPNALPGLFRGDRPLTRREYRASARENAEH